MSTSPTRSRRRHERASQSDSAKPAGTGAADAPDAKRKASPKAEDGAPANLVHSGKFWAIARNSNEELRELEDVAAVKQAIAGDTDRIWIDLISPDHELLGGLADVLGLHPLITEDILESNQRAKVEIYAESLHLVMFGLTYEGEILSHEIDIVLGPRYLLTSHDADIDPRNAPFTKRAEGFHLSGGPDYVLWAIADWIVDGYFPVFDRLGDEIDDLESDVMRKPSAWIVERLFRVRRDLLLIRHAVNPQREIFNQLTNRDSKLIQPERIVYFRDVYDHLIRLTDELDSYRELVSTTLDVYLSQVNNNLSEIMKRLTGVTVILATIGAFGGIFGMSEAGAAFNFQEAAGFWIVTGVAIGLAVVIFVYFRRRNWI
jgi:magnesium transporter